MSIAYNNEATGKSTGTTNRKTHSLYFSEVNNGWNIFRIPEDDSSWTTGGTGATLKAPVKWISIMFFQCAGLTFYLDTLFQGGRIRPQFVWMFDTTVTSAVNSVFSGYGWKWAIDVPDNYLVSGGTTTYEASIAAGAEPVLNDVQDRSLKGMSRIAVAEMIAANKAVFDSRGWDYNPELYAYNTNQYDDNVVLGLQDAGIKYARAGVLEGRFVNHEFGIANPLRAGSQSMDNQDFATLKSWIDALIKSGSSAVWYQHAIVTGGVVGGGGQTGLDITSITSSGTTATVTTVANHNINTTGRVTISGCTGTHADKFNISANATVAGLDTFTYTIADASDTSAEGTPVYANIGCSASLSQYSEDFIALAAYIRQKEQQGLIKVSGLSEWWESCTVGPE
jgi:hypothetical protein